eukprot:4142761-Amphidinium_carterae.1
MALAPNQLISSGNYVPVRKALMPGQAGSILMLTLEEYHRLCKQADLTQSDHPQAIVTPTKYALPE